MILVVGASGILGYEICQQLCNENLPVRAMVRESTDPAKINRLRELGVEIARGDLRKSRSFIHALQGVNALISTASSMPFSYVPGENDPVLVDRNGIKSLVDQAKIAGVSHFIYTSFSGNINLDFPLCNAKREVEKHLLQSGMTFTILRPSYLMETWHSATAGFDVKNARVQLYGEGTKRVSYISYRDVARFAVMSLQNPHARNAILELGGPEKLSQLDAVRIFEEVSGRKFELEHLPIEKLRLRFGQATDHMQKSFSGLMLCLANGDPIDMKDTSKKFSIKLKSVREYA